MRNILVLMSTYNGEKYLKEQIYAQPDKVSNTETAYPGCCCRCS